jgi:hypothetical protein
MSYEPSVPAPELISQSSCPTPSWYRSQPLSPTLTPIDLGAHTPNATPTPHYWLLSSIRDFIQNRIQQIRSCYQLRDEFSILSQEVELLKREIKWTHDFLIRDSVRWARARSRQEVRLHNLEQRVISLDCNTSHRIPEDVPELEEIIIIIINGCDIPSFIFLITQPNSY